jgi:broad specificity phosphatase PhoE
MPDDSPRPLRSAPGAGVTRLFLIRHGATPANEMRPYIMQGSELDHPLSAAGEAQAAAVGNFLRWFNLAAVYSSPLRRAVQTATAIAERQGKTVETIAALRECSVGQWEGLSWDVIRERHSEDHARFFDNPVDVPHPGGESYGDVLKRARPAIDDILKRHVGENVAIVAHNMLNRVVLAELAGIELRHARRLKQTNACINLLEVRDGTLSLVSLNSVLHLDEV